MCLAAPMEIIELRGSNKALVRQNTLELEIDISLIENAEIGDHVIVHAGFAIDKLDLKEAEERLKLFQALGES